MSRTVTGRETTLIGANRATAEISGISFTRVTIVAFAIFSVGLALAGILNGAAFGQATAVSFPGPDDRRDRRRPGRRHRDPGRARLAAPLGRRRGPDRRDLEHDGAQRFQHRRPAGGAGRRGGGDRRPARSPAPATGGATRDGRASLARLGPTCCRSPCWSITWIVISAITPTFRGRGERLLGAPGLPAGRPRRARPRRDDHRRRVRPVGRLDGGALRGDRGADLVRPA